MTPQFQTDYVYTERADKAKYVWLKYQSILQGSSILDVGADECHLRDYLSDDTKYWGIGLGGNPDQVINLETDKIPFDDNQYDVTICLDVLEHIENPHEIFDELCRISKNYIIISLPNAWSSMLRSIREGKETMKYYGLPIEKPSDRHKWFFSFDEAKEFIEYRSKLNNMSVVQIDEYHPLSNRQMTQWVRRIAQYIIFRNNPIIENFYKGMLWAVIEKR